MGAPRGHDPAGRLRPPADGAAHLIKRSVVVAGHRTSVSLEDAFWTALAALARDQNLSINALIGEIDRGRAGNLSSAIRVYVLERKRP
ncbi:MAG: aryl-sulfate sulfotransferase [Alphaproteobacteria bacterium]|nr:aryl-sulfate sulfotransferase [Alphaproteobacteria bacterium]